MRHRIRHIHFVGIGGVGMSGLAQVMQQMQYRVSGSDAREQKSVARLRACGIEVFVGHHASNIVGADCVVYSSAVRMDNVECAAARAADIPMIPRAQMLAELMRFKQGIAVAGTHGKTTVTSMIHTILVAANWSPTCVLGGRLMNGEAGAVLGSGDYIVAEADESDASFLHLHPVIGVVTNIDNDHMERFDDSLEQLAAAFSNFLAALPFYGAAVLCYDDARTRAIGKTVVQSRVVSYGLSPAADHCASDLQADENGVAFAWQHQDANEPMYVRAWGRHNVQNALAACAVATELGVDRAAIVQGLRHYAGVERRLQPHGTLAVRQQSLTLVDDYAHHPTEITATINAVRQTHSDSRLVLIFQPHRYSRTQRLLSELALSLTAADVLILLPIYPAGESAPAANGVADWNDELFVTIPAQVNKYACADFAAVCTCLESIAADGDVLLTMGAGDVGGMPRQLKERYGVAS